jgi:hypothetical protein
MSGAIPPFPQYAFMAWCSVKSLGQLYFYLYFTNREEAKINGENYIIRSFRTCSLHPVLLLKGGDGWGI